MSKRLLALFILKQYYATRELLNDAFPRSMHEQWSQETIDRYVDLWLSTIKFNKDGVYKRVEVDYVIIGESPTGMDIYKRLHSIDWRDVKEIVPCFERTTDVLLSFSIMYYS